MLTLNPQPLTLNAPVWLLAAVPTHVRTWPRGSRFDRSVWFVDETDGEPIELVNLIDSTGWVRISLCPAELVSREAIEREEFTTETRSHEAWPAESSVSSAGSGSESSSGVNNTREPAASVPHGSGVRSSGSAMHAGEGSVVGNVITADGSAAVKSARSDQRRFKQTKTERTSTWKPGVVLSLAPCECGFFTSSGTQCKGCGARLEGSDATDEAPAGLVNHGAAKAGRTRSTSRESAKPVETKLEPHLTRPGIDDVNAELASIGRVSSPAPVAPVRDINAELQELGRSTLNPQPSTSVEACPFEPTGEIPRATYSPVLLTPNEDRDEIRPYGSRLIVRKGWMRPHVELIQPARYYDPEKLRAYNARWVADAKARLAAVGWKFEEPEFTTETRRHGEQCQTQPNQATTIASQATTTSTKTTTSVASASDAGVKVQTTTSAADRASSATGPDGSDLYSGSRLLPLTSRLSNEADHIASPGPAGAAGPAPAEDPRRVRGQCEPGEYPDPSSDWDRNQRLGFRYVKGSGMRFGADSIEDLDRWRTWLGRVREFNQTEAAC